MCSASSLSREPSLSLNRKTKGTMPKKQAELPGVEAPSIKAIDDAADEYVSVRDKRMALTEKEITARDVLANLMHKHKLESYRYDDRIVTIVPAEKVKVKTAKEESAKVEVDPDDEN